MVNENEIASPAEKPFRNDDPSKKSVCLWQKTHKKNPDNFRYRDEYDQLKRTSLF